MFYRVDASGLLLFVRLVPKSSANGIVGIEDRNDGKQHLVVRVCSVPENGRANRELIKFLAKLWGIPPLFITLKNGATSRYKQVHFSGKLEKLEMILQHLSIYSSAQK
ncbi:DUF167 domain-containing protein [Bartonella ancashensis]|uniref:UPF0235 protein PU02_1323 n=1 Tax=Bartonella ancashensis TaxID=1318743 RepID=A0A0M4M4L2_9HYPH|nr:DUF167 family protein [Bartonella ancashensis]ALE04137.1 hypothetical protein PU02_1323 [Bartonella ancashensis]